MAFEDRPMSQRSGQTPPESARPPGSRAGHAGRRSRWWWAGLGLVVANMALVGGLAAEGSVLAQPGGTRYVIEVLLALAGYAGAAIALSAASASWAATAHQVGVRFGLITGAMWLVSLTVETFAGLTGWSNIAATGPLLLGGFALWGIAGARTRGRTDSVAAGALAAVYAAMICVTLTIGFGFTLAYLALPQLEHNIDGSPEYLQSGWRNLHAFAIANTLDAGFTHLLIAPIIATVVGTIGALAAGQRRAILDHH